MNYKNILKVSLAALASVAIFAGCAKTQEFEEITEIKLSRCLEPQNLSAKVDVTTGQDVTFGWDVNKDAQLYILTVYKDAELSQKVQSWEIPASDVPYTTKLTADEKYWFTVQAFRVDADGFAIESTGSKVAAFDSDSGVKTYAVKDNLYLAVAGRTSTSVSLTWSKDAADYEEVTHISAAPVKGGKTVKKELSSAEAKAAAATVEGLEASSEYQVTLFYMSASRGSVDVWTPADAGSLTQVSNSEELLANVTAGGSVYLKYSGSPYTIGGSKPTASIRMVGEPGPNGEKPVVIGNFDVSSIVAEGTEIIAEGIKFDDENSHNHLINYSGGATKLGNVKFINCEITNFKAGLFYNNKTGDGDLLTVGDIVFESCDIYNMAASMSGDCIDFRKSTHSDVKSIQLKNNTIWDGLRTLVRFGDDTSIDEGNVKCGGFIVENNTIKNVSTINNSNNRGIFAIRVATSMTLKNNLFLYEDTPGAEGKNAENKWLELCQLFQDNSGTVVPTLNAENNYSYANGDAFFAKVEAGAAGFKVLTEDPCYNAKGNFFQLANQDLIEGKVGASKWWISYVEKPEDLTQNFIEGAHVWNLQDATLFAGEVKNSRVRDELLLVGTEETPLNADGGINFLSASPVTRKGAPIEGYAAFKVKDTAGSVDLQVANGGSASVVIGLLDDNGFAVIGGAMASANAGVQKIVIPEVKGEGQVQIFSTGAISLTKLAWSLDTKAGNKVLATPKLTVEPVTLTEGDETAVTATWNAVDNAASYVVKFNRKTQELEPGALSCTIPAEAIAELEAGLYSFTITAVPAEGDIYYQESQEGSVSIAIQPKGGSGALVPTEVTLVWDFSDEVWQSEFAKLGSANTDIATWDLTVDGLQIYAATKCKYNTTFFQFGGAGVNTTTNNWDRHFKFSAPAEGTLKVRASNTGSSEDLSRMVCVKAGDSDVQSLAGGYPSTSPQELEFAIGSGDVMISTTGNGLRFYRIEFTYIAMLPGEEDSPVEYNWDFSTEVWQSEFAKLGSANTDIATWDLTVDGLQIYAATKCKYNTTFFQFGGAGVNTTTNNWDRHFKFTAPKAGTLKVRASNTGSSEDLSRMVCVKAGDADVLSLPGGYASTAPQELEFAIGAGEVMISTTGNGLRFYVIHYLSE